MEDFVVAAILLMAPGVEAEKMGPEVVKQYSMHLNLIGHEFELFHHQDLNWRLSCVPIDRTELGTLRTRFVDSLNWPSYADRKNWPDTDMANKSLELNHNFARWVEGNMLFGTIKQDIGDIVLEETTICRNRWEILRYISYDHSGHYHVRQSLNELRLSIGPHNYYNRVLPASIPVWRLPKR